MADISALYPQAQQPKPFNPFEAIQAATGIQAFQKNQLELNASKAIGDEYRNALSPDGLDIGKLISGVKSNPSAAYGLPEATTHILGQQGTQFNNLNAQSRAVMDFIGSMAQDPTLTKEKMYNQAVSFGRSNNIPASVIGPLLMGAPSDNEGVRNHVRTLANAARGAAASAEISPFTDPATGQTINAPKGATMFAGAQGGIPGALPGSLPAGGAESAGAMQADLRRAGTFKQDVFPLERALDLAKKLGPGGMAPGSKGRQDFESMVYGMMPSLVPAGLQEKIKNYAELEKYLANNASQRAQNLGPHTNEGLGMAITGSPNVHTNDLAGVDLIKAQIALRRMEHSHTTQAAKVGPAGYTAERARLAAGLEPSAYSIDLMEPEQIAKLKKTLKGADRERFNVNLKSAIDSGALVRQ